MKFWEVIKELTDDPTKVYEAQLQGKGWTVRMTVDSGFSRYFKFEVFNGERLIDQSLAGGAFNWNVALNLGWKLVRQPVPWQEAIQAWADGKKVAWEEEAGRRVFDMINDWLIPSNQVQMIDQDGDAVTVRMLSGGTWYVED